VNFSTGGTSNSGLQWSILDNGHGDGEMGGELTSFFYVFLAAALSGKEAALLTGPDDEGEQTALFSGPTTKRQQGSLLQEGGDCCQGAAGFFVCGPRPASLAREG
jgi:hypothetical protein